MVHMHAKVRFFLQRLRIIKQPAASANAGQAGSDRLLWLGVLLGAGAVVLRIIVLAASLEHVPVTADESITVLQAKRVCAGEWPLLVMAQPYQFPVEAYLSAPLVHLVPRNTFGARYLSFLEGFLGLALLFLLARQAGAWRQTWPVLLLIAFPSAYLLTIQFGYSLPHNTPIYLCAWGALLLTLGAPASPAWRRWPRFLLAGLLCGLAFTNNMVALALIAPILLAAVFQGGWRRIPSNVFLLAAGVFIGLIPFYAATQLYPGAHEAVADTRSLAHTLSYLWTPAFTVTLTRALGITPNLFPDAPSFLDFMPWLFPVTPWIVAGILLAATALRAGVLLRQLLRGQAPAFETWDVFIGVAWLNLALFSASARGNSGCIRYLAPAAWSFPFLVGAVYAAAGQWGRRLLGALCVGLAVVNILTAVKLTQAWRAPDFAEAKVDAPDLWPAIEFLRRQGIGHCVASHWQAYRLNYYTDETILCSQPFNERFTEWPLPFKDRVDASTNVAYVLSEFSSQDVNPACFEADLRRMRITAQKSVQGKFSIYYNFTGEQGLTNEIQLAPDQIEAATSHNPADAHQLLIDRAGRWTTQCLQEKGMWIELKLKEPRWLSRLVLIYDDYFGDRAPVMDISIRDGDAWRLVGENVPEDLDPFEFINGHPVYRRFVQTYRSAPPVLTDGVRLDIVEANPRRSWTLMKIELYALPAPAGN
jgi:hypothetical protein